MAADSERDRYYCDEVSAVPFRVLARGLSQSMLVPMAYVMAAYIRMRGFFHWYSLPNYGMKAVADTRIVAAAQLSPQAWSKWAPYLEQLRDLQFVPIAHRQPDIIGAREQCSLLLLHAHGKTTATLEWMRTPGANGPQEEVSLELNSYGDHDPDILTGVVNAAHLVLVDMFSLAFVDTCFMSNEMPIRKLFEKHKQRVGNRVMLRLDSDSAQNEHLSRANRRFDWMLKTGLIRQLTPREVGMVRLKILPNRNS